MPAVKLTPKQEAFAIAYAKGATQADAYREAYPGIKMGDNAVYVQASRLMTNPKVSLRIQELKASALIAANIEVTRTLQEIARIAYCEPRRFFDAAGGLKHPAQWDDAMAAAISSIEVVTRGTGEFDSEQEVQPNGGTLTRRRNPKVEYVHKLKFWDKNAALEKAMKHLGLFEKDNRQLRPNLAIQINVVESPKNGQG